MRITPSMLCSGFEKRAAEFWRFVDRFNVDHALAAAKTTATRVETAGYWIGVLSQFRRSLRPADPDYALKLKTVDAKLDRLRNAGDGADIRDAVSDDAPRKMKQLSFF